MLTEATKRQLNQAQAGAARAKAMYDTKAAYGLMTPAQAMKFNQDVISQQEYNTLRSNIESKNPLTYLGALLGPASQLMRVR